MSKKHFIAIADAIKAHNAVFQTKFLDSQISAIADCLATQNPNFKRDRFISYIAGECGPSGEAVKK